MAQVDNIEKRGLQLHYDLKQESKAKVHVVHKAFVKVQQSKENVRGQKTQN